MSQSAESTKEFIDQIKKGGWRFFEVDDVHLYNDDILIAFAQCGTFFMDRIPRHMMTDPVLSVVAELDKTNQCLRFFTPDDTPIYRELAVKAVASSSGNLMYVSEDFVDAEFVRDTVTSGPSSLCAFLRGYPAIVHQIYDKPGLEALLSADTIARNQVVSDALKGKFETPLITDDFIQQSLLVCNGLIGSVLKTDKKHLVLDLINRGEWPEAYAKDKPEDLKDAVKRMMKPMSSVAQSWQKAYAMTFGVAEVVKAMKAPSKMELLEAIYTREEILPHLTQRKDLKAKGRWLEDSLGL